MELKIYTIKDIDEICRLIKNNSAVFGMRTDTVYGMICSAYDKKAIDRIYNIKNRDKNKPLGLFVDKKILYNDEIKNIVDIEKFDYDLFYHLADKYWPGAITFILDKNINNQYLKHISDNDKIALRAPDNKIILDIIKKIDIPLAQTSLNLSGDREVTTFDELVEKFGGKLDFAIKCADDDCVNDNISSTILEIDKLDYKIIRKGKIEIND